MYDKLPRLRVLALVEGLSLLLLVFVAVPLKHLAHMPLPVRVVGMFHGLAFLAFVAALLDAYSARQLTGRDVGLAVLGAVLPGGSFVVARRTLRGPAS